MRPTVASLLLLLVTGVCSSSSQRPIPRGIRDGDKAVQNGEEVEPPVENRTRKLDANALKAEAAQLQMLANSLPPQVDQVTKGMIPKDIADNLKKIEKLAKHLRSEINP
jgi:hypothetical protein